MIKEDLLNRAHLVHSNHTNSPNDFLFVAPELKSTVSGRTRKRAEVVQELEPKKPQKKVAAPVKEEKLTYESLGVEPPEQFDYANYPDVSKDRSFS